MKKKFNLTIAEQQAATNYSDYRGVTSVDLQMKALSLLKTKGYNPEEWFLFGFDFGGPDDLGKHPTHLTLDLLLFEKEKYGHNFDEIESNTHNTEVEVHKQRIDIPLSELPSIIKRYRAVLVSPISQNIKGIRFAEKE